MKFEENLEEYSNKIKKNNKFIEAVKKAKKIYLDESQKLQNIEKNFSNKKKTKLSSINKPHVKFFYNNFE